MLEQLADTSSSVGCVHVIDAAEEIQSLARKEGTTVFLTTHNLVEAEKLCDTIAIMHQGRIRACGTLEELLSQTKTTELEDAFVAAVGGEWQD